MTEAYDDINPAHYRTNNSEADDFECIKVLESWMADDSHMLCTAMKYICRYGKKPGEDHEKCLQKAVWYLERPLEYGSRNIPAIDLSLVMNDGDGLKWVDEHYSADVVADAWKLKPNLRAALRFIFLAFTAQETAVYHEALAGAVDSLERELKTFDNPQKELF